MKTEITDTDRLNALELLYRNCPHAEIIVNDDPDVEESVGVTIRVEGCLKTEWTAPTLREALNCEVEVQRARDIPTGSDEEIARKAAEDLIDWIAGPVPWQEWERADTTNCILTAIKKAKSIAFAEIDKELYGALLPLSYEPDRAETIRTILKIARPQELAPFALNEQVRFILGRPNFITSPIAHRLRALGHDIKTKCEDEQAHVLHWLLHLYFADPKTWRDEANRVLKAEQNISDFGQR